MSDASNRERTNDCVKTEICDAVQKCQLDPSDKSKDSNILSKTNNVTHVNGMDLLSQENQDYDSRHDQQLTTRKHDNC